jgi:cytochrome b
MPLSQYLFAGDAEERPTTAGGEDVGARENDDEEGLLGEVHELFANLLIGFVALHVGYLILFKWPLARFMLFVRQPSKAKTTKA